MKSLLCITAYAKTEKKREILRRCIQSAKSLGMDILISSHAALPEDIIESVDYYIYDADNRFSNSDGIFFWKSVDVVTITVASRVSHEYPILKLMRNYLHLAKANKYEFLFQMDFDCILSETDVQQLLSLRDRLIEEEKDFIFFHPLDASWRVDGVDLIGIYYDLYVYGGKVNKMLDVFEAYFPDSIERYNESLGKIEPGRPKCLEYYFYDAFKTKRVRTVLVNQYVNEFLTSSSLNESRLINNVCKILPANNGKYYLYIANDNIESFKFKVQINGVTSEYDLVGNPIPASYSLIELNEESNIVVEILDNERVIDTYELEYRTHLHPNYDMDGNIRFHNI